MASTCALTESKFVWGPKLEKGVNIEGSERIIFFKDQNHNI